MQSDNINKIRTMGNLDTAKQLSNELHKTILKSNSALANLHDRMNEMRVNEKRVLDIINNSDKNRKI